MSKIRPIQPLLDQGRSKGQILDDFGLPPFRASGRAALMELIENRRGKGALIVTSQVPVNKWYEVIGEQTIADAILDRIVHSAHRLELKGESLESAGWQIQKQVAK